MLPPMMLGNLAIVANRRTPNDAFGASFLYTHISPRVSALDLDEASFSGPNLPVRKDELSLEFNYSFSMVPGWTIQPNIAVVFNPGGGSVPRPGSIDQTERIKNALLFGARSVVRY